MKFGFIAKHRSRLAGWHLALRSAWRIVSLASMPWLKRGPCARSREDEAIMHPRARN